jgi:hypothetical protein
MIFKQLNVVELFLDCITEPNEKLVEFGLGGICNSCVGKYGNLPSLQFLRNLKGTLFSNIKYNDGWALERDLTSFCVLFLQIQ